MLDTKLARRAKTKFVVQLAFYSELLARIQGCTPHLMHVFLGDQTEKSFACSQFSRYVANVVQRFQNNVALSRAKSLALLVANPELMFIKCSTPEQMALVNALCWVWEYSGGHQLNSASYSSQYA